MFQSKEQQNEQQKAEKQQIQAMYEQYGFAVYRRCKTFLRNESLAEDAVQEVFLRLSRSISRIPKDNKCYAYIYRIAINVCIDLINEKKIVHENFVNASFQEFFETNVQNQKENQFDLQEFLHKQTKEIQEIVYLHFFEGLTYDEIAEILPFSRRSLIRKLEDFLQKAKKYFNVTK